MVANHLRSLSNLGHGNLPDHYFVFPTVTMFVAAFEAFLQEQLELLRESEIASKGLDKEFLIEEFDDLKAQKPPFKEFKEWVKEVYKRFDRVGVGIDSNSDEYQNLLALKELRNSVIHYNPSFIENIYWPSRLEQALHCTKVQVLNAGWVTNFSRVEVADWAHDTVKRAVQLFCSKSGTEDPFTISLESDGMPPWE